MKLTITSLRLRSLFQFFSLSYNAMLILKQLKAGPSKGIKTTGIGLTHYTMSLWETEKDMHDFYKSGAHLEAMKKSKKIAREIRTLTLEADDFKDWKTAKTLLKEQGKILRF